LTGADASASAGGLDGLLALAVECVHRAGGLLIDHFAGPAREVRTKSGPRDLVSAADLAAEDTIRMLIARDRPGDGVLGEEHDETRSQSGLRWDVDPLDGTANFLRRIPHWCVSVACVDAVGPLVGAVYDPLRGECFTGARGRGATLADAPLQGSGATDLRIATLGGEFSAHTPAQADRTRRLVSSVGHVRSYGSAALDLAWAAAGRFDAVYHGRFPSPWDVAAGSLLCYETGLSVERLAGDGDADASLLAAPRSLAAPLRALIAGSSTRR
jgi:myo-inositol-1(or 4)-monophosphatase